MRRIAMFAFGLPAFVAAASSGFGQIEIYRKTETGVGPNGPEIFVSLAGGEDVDADGVADFVVGTSPRVLPSTVISRAIVYSGRDGSSLLSFSGDSPGDAFGRSVALLGDLNGDGHSEILVGASRGLSEKGYARVFSGANGASLFYLQGSTNDDLFGHATAKIGDTNGDGVSEFAVSAWGDYPYDTNVGSGYVRLFSGANGQLLRQFCTCCGNCSGEPSADGFGFSVAGAGDVNADGAADIIVGSNGFGVLDYPPGLAKLYSGADGSLLGSFSGVGTGDLYGFSVAGVGDLNADGYDDFAIGAPLVWNGPSNRVGKIELRSGNGGGLLYSVIPNASSHPEEFRLGYSIRPAGDTDGDGVPDFLIGSQYLSGIPASSLCSGVDGRALRVWQGRVPTGIGDLNGDGFGDYAGIETALSSFSNFVGVAVRAFLAHAPAPVIYGTPKINSLGCESPIRVSGAPSLSVGNNFVISSDHLINQAPGLLIWGLSPASIPFAGGTLWVGSPIVRTVVQSTGGNLPPLVDCTGSMSFPFTQQNMIAAGLLPGTRVYCQFYSRDAGFAFPNNVSLTAGVQFVVLP